MGRLSLSGKIPETDYGNAGNPRSMRSLQSVRHNPIRMQVRGNRRWGMFADNPPSVGAQAGVRQCNGNYEMQTNPVNEEKARCALTGKGIRYWELIPGVYPARLNGRLHTVPI